MKRITTLLSLLLMACFLFAQIFLKLLKPECQPQHLLLKRQQH